MTDYEDDLEMDSGETNVDEALPSGGARPIAYVRPLTEDEIESAPREVRAAAKVALHDEDGRAIAFFPDRNTAIAAAMVNDFTPVSVH